MLKISLGKWLPVWQGVGANTPKIPLQEVGHVHHMCRSNSPAEQRPAELLLLMKKQKNLNACAGPSCEPQLWSVLAARRG